MKVFVAFAAIALQLSTAFEIECPETGTYLMRDPRSCSTFFRCSNGVATTLECPSGMYFDEVTGVCDRSSNVDCVIEEVPEPETEEPEVETTEEPEVESTEEPEVESTEQPEDESTEEPEVETTEEPELESTEEPEVESTEEPEVESTEEPEVESTEEPEVEKPEEPEDESTEEPEIDSPEEPEDPKPDPDPENDFCPSEGQHFFPYPFACYKFIECNEGVKRILNCIDGLYWNPDLGHCDLPENVNCEIIVTTEKPKPDRPGPGPVGECPEENTGYGVYLPDGADCTIFYQCDWGKPMKRRCAPPGLHFNPVLSVCDWPEYAGCKAA